VFHLYSDYYTNKLYKFRRGLLKLGVPISVFIPPGKVSFKGLACNHNLNDLIILHVHKEQVGRVDLDKIGENNVSGRVDIMKIGLFCEQFENFVGS